MNGIVPVGLVDNWLKVRLLEIKLDLKKKIEFFMYKLFFNLQYNTN